MTYKILVDILHPAHVHKLRNLLWRLQKEGNTILITARDKDVACRLLDAYKFPYKILTPLGKNFPTLAKELLVRYYKLFRICKKYKPDLILGCSGTNIALISRITGIPSYVLADTEDPKLAGKLAYFFADKIVTPKCFRRDFKRHIKFDSFFEVAYLHPEFFKPDENVKKDLNLKENEKYSIVRFVSWKASHDLFEKGLDLQFKKNIVEELSKIGKVFISSEGNLEPELQKYQIKVSPEKIHSVLYYAQMYVGDSQTMATEAGILGTPSVRCNSLVGTEHGSGQFDELQKKYGVVYSFSDPKEALSKIKEMVNNSSIKEKWQKKREFLIQDKVNTTEFLINLVKEQRKSN